MASRKTPRRQGGRKYLTPLLGVVLVSGLVLAGWAFLDLLPIPPPQVAAVAGAPHGSASDDTSPPQILSAEEQTIIMYPDMPAVGDRVGTITLPSVSESWPIYQGTTRKQLSDGVGHFVGSVLPGVHDNSVLSGHRTTVFARLGELVVGDLIHIHTSAGAFTYQVREFAVVPHSSQDVIVSTPTAVLTLTTAYPFMGWVISPNVFVVSADLVGSKLSQARGS